MHVYFHDVSILCYPVSSVVFNLCHLPPTITFYTASFFPSPFAPFLSSIRRFNVHVFLSFCFIMPVLIYIVVSLSPSTFHFVYFFPFWSIPCSISFLRSLPHSFILPFLLSLSTSPSVSSTLSFEYTYHTTPDIQCKAQDLNEPYKIMAHITFKLQTCTSLRENKRKYTQNMKSRNDVMLSD